MEALDEPGDVSSWNNNTDSLLRDYFFVVVAAACLLFVALFLNFF